MKHARIEKGRRGSTKPLRELEDWNFYRKNEVLGLLRLEISEKGNSLGNVEVIEAVGERLRIVHDRMNGFSGDMYRLLSEVKREIGKITGTKNFGNSDDVQKKRGRPSKNTEAKRDEA